MDVKTFSLREEAKEARRLPPVLTNLAGCTIRVVKAGVGLNGTPYPAEAKALVVNLKGGTSVLRLADSDTHVLCMAMKPYRILIATHADWKGNTDRSPKPIAFPLTSFDVTDVIDWKKLKALYGAEGKKLSSDAERYRLIFNFTVWCITKQFLAGHLDLPHSSELLDNVKAKMKCVIPADIGEFKSATAASHLSAALGDAPVFYSVPGEPLELFVKKQQFTATDQGFEVSKKPSNAAKDGLVMPCFLGGATSDETHSTDLIVSSINGFVGSLKKASTARLLVSFGLVKENLLPCFSSAQSQQMTWFVKCIAAFLCFIAQNPKSQPAALYGLVDSDVGTKARQAQEEFQNSGLESFGYWAVHGAPTHLNLDVAGDGKLKTLYKTLADKIGKGTKVGDIGEAISELKDPPVKPFDDARGCYGAISRLGFMVAYYNPVWKLMGYEFGWNPKTGRLWWKQVPKDGKAHGPKEEMLLQGEPGPKGGELRDEVEESLLLDEKEGPEKLGVVLNPKELISMPWSVRLYRFFKCGMDKGYTKKFQEGLIDSATKILNRDMNKLMGSARAVTVAPETAQAAHKNLRWGMMAWVSSREASKGKKKKGHKYLVKVLHYLQGTDLVVVELQDEKTSESIPKTGLRSIGTAFGAEVEKCWSTEKMSRVQILSLSSKILTEAPGGPIDPCAGPTKEMELIMETARGIQTHCLTPCGKHSIIRHLTANVGDSEKAVSLTDPADWSAYIVKEWNKATTNGPNLLAPSRFVAIKLIDDYTLMMLARAYFG